MPARPLPNLLLQAFFDLGEKGWNDEYDLNMLKLSVLVQSGVSGKFAAEPGAPAAGTIIVLDEDHATHPNAIGVFDDGEWVYFLPNKGWLTYDMDEDHYLTYNGVVWTVLATGGGGGGIEEAPADGTPYSRQDGDWVPASEGGGGGPGVVTPPVVVSRAFSRSYGTDITLPWTPTEGNMLIAMVFSRDYPDAGSGWVRIGLNDGSNINRAVAMARVVEAGDDADIQPSNNTGDVCSFVVFEIDAAYVPVGGAAGTFDIVIGHCTQAINDIVFDDASGIIVGVGAQDSGVGTFALDPDTDDSTEIAATDFASSYVWGGGFQWTGDAGSYDLTFDANDGANSNGYCYVRFPLVTTGGGGGGSGCPCLERVTAQYWRIRAGTPCPNGGQNSFLVKEAHFYEEDGATVIDMTGGTPIHSGGGSNPANAFDGNGSNYWECSGYRNDYGLNTWVGMQFAGPVAPFSFDYKVYYNNAGPGETHLDYSDDGIAWYTHTSFFTGDSWVGDTYKTFVVPERTRVVAAP